MAAARRAFWKGYLKPSLVTCPIDLYPALSQSEKTQFHQINRKTGNRLRQQMVDEETGEIVEKADKGRGYELSKGKYVEIEPEEIKAIQVESTHILNIEKFVPAGEIDRRYFEKAYYIIPDGRAGEEAFAVIRDAMKDKGRVALARIVLTNREHVMAIEPFGKGLLGTTLRYNYEVSNERHLFKSVPSPKIPKEMVNLASHILDSKAGHFDPSNFKDEFELELRKLVRQKAAGKAIKVPKERERPSNVINLMDALRQSVQGGGRTRTFGASPKSTKPKSASKKRKSRRAA
jgi:Ku protein